ncbi:MAG TPA: hypothetical protein VJL29_12085 [Thermoguttaceae bacterium]|nr:hypothetical protein [Thermoguttaceae bacterium]
MGRVLDALKEIESRPKTPRTAATKHPTATDGTKPASRRMAAVEPAVPPPDDPRYREIVSAVLSRLTLHGGTVFLMAGFSDEEPRGGQWAALYPSLARHVEGGLLVVEAARRGQGLGERFDARGGYGLANVLAGQVAWQNAVHGTTHQGLYLLPARGEASSSDGTTAGDWRVASTADWSPLAAQWRHAHRLVVVDAILSTPREMADWAAVCDAVVLFARLEVTPRREVRRAIRAIQNRGAQILGCVLLES